jgi:hypothetical protein
VSLPAPGNAITSAPTCGATGAPSVATGLSSPLVGPGTRTGTSSGTC